MAPQSIVKKGSHTRGDAFFSTKLLGSSLRTCISSLPVIARKNNTPADIEQIEHRQTDIILVVSDSDILLQTNYLCIANICAIEEGAQEE